MPEEGPDGWTRPVIVSLDRAAGDAQFAAEAGQLAARLQVLVEQGHAFGIDQAHRANGMPSFHGELPGPLMEMGGFDGSDRPSYGAEG